MIPTRSHVRTLVILCFALAAILPAVFAYAQYPVQPTVSVQADHISIPPAEAPISVDLPDAGPGVVILPEVRVVGRKTGPVVASARREPVIGEWHSMLQGPGGRRVRSF